MTHSTTPSSPKTPEQKRIETLENENQELKALVSWYKEHFRLNQHRKFGASSEKVPTNQLELPLFNEAEVTATSPEEDPEPETLPTEKKKRPRQGRQTQTKHLPVDTVIYTLSEEEQACSSCGHDMSVMKKEIRKELKVIPAQVKIIQHEQEVYVCRKCDEENITTPIVSAPMPNPVYPKSMASPSAVAHVLTQKYMVGQPLYRQEQQFHQLGVALSRQTLSNWILYVADRWIDPMIQQMKSTLLNEEVLHADETTVQVLKEKGRSASSTSYMWLYRTGREGPRCILFDYQTTRAARYPKRFLEGFKGILHVDGYKGYEGLSAVVLSGCWTHARRKFDEAQKAALPKQGGQLTIAEQALQKIGAIYKIEKKIALMEPEERLTIRQKESIPLVEAYFAWLKSIRPKVLPKSKLGKAIQYSLNQRKKLEVPFKDGRLDIDNNRAERSIKPFVIGRKNWLFSHTPKGARASAMIYSLIETAKENKLSVFHYLTYLFESLPNVDINDPNELHKHLPWSNELPEQCYLKEE
ncbi:MAG TPA: IS66 family transposase [Bacillales bacterium]|nr:IS66 family transposase [Bacillales bacterium]